MMKWTLATLALATAPFLTACGGASAPATGETVAPTSFAAEIDHDHFPMPPGATWIYEGMEERSLRREVVRVLPEPRTILGVACRALEQEIHIDGELVERTVEWYAQDRRGDVWRFGEVSQEVDERGVLVETESWIAGEEGVRPWVVLGADPQVGDVYRGYGPDGEESFVVRSVRATAMTPAGTFEGCVEVEENPDDVEDADIILYAHGTGRVQERTSTGFVQLVRFEVASR